MKIKNTTLCWNPETRLVKIFKHPLYPALKGEDWFTTGAGGARWENLPTEIQVGHFLATAITESLECDIPLEYFRDALLKIEECANAFEWSPE